MRKALQTARSEQATVVCLVPARTDTKWFWDTARYGEIRFLKGRVKFVTSETIVLPENKRPGAPFPSAVVIFRCGDVWPNVSFWDWRSERKDTTNVR